MLGERRRRAGEAVGRARHHPRSTRRRPQLAPRPATAQHMTAHWRHQGTFFLFWIFDSVSSNRTNRNRFVLVLISQKNWSVPVHWEPDLCGNRGTDPIGSVRTECPGLKSSFALVLANDKNGGIRCSRGIGVFCAN
jgi:hypothetical protein